MDQPAKVPASPRRRWKWLRIGWSAVFVGMALGITGLWVRSYWWHDYAGYTYLTNYWSEFDSERGGLHCSRIAQSTPQWSHWEYNTWKVDPDTRFEYKTGWIRLPGVSVYLVRAGSPAARGGHSIGFGIYLRYWFLVLISAALAYV